MKRIALAILVALMPAAFLHAQVTVFVGEVADQAVVEGVNIPCPEGRICMSAWFRWKIDVDHFTDGPPVKGRIAVASIQHGHFTVDYLERLTCFTVAPIERAEQRRLLGADYELVDKWTEDDSHKAAACAFPAKAVRRAPLVRLPHRD